MFLKPLSVHMGSRHLLVATEAGGTHPTGMLYFFPGYFSFSPPLGVTGS